jgi:hypothetical protein
MDDSARTSVALLVRRTRSVSDGQGNTFGIIDVNPDDSDPAILLGIRIGDSGERFGRVLRLGDRIESDGLELTVAELVPAEPAWLVLDGTVPTREDGA